MRDASGSAIPGNLSTLGLNANRSEKASQTVSYSGWECSSVTGLASERTLRYPIWITDDRHCP